MSQVKTMPKRRRDTGEPPEQPVSITVRFPPSLRKRALAVAQAEDRTFASLVVYALRRYVTEREQGEVQAQNGQ